MSSIPTSVQMTRKLSLSSNPSTTSLDSLFSRFDTAPTLSITPAATLPQFQVLHSKDVCDLLHKRIESKTVVMLVGLPASGKSTVCKQLAETLQQNNYKSLIYNAGNIRRMMKLSFSDAEFFNPDNEAATQQREHFATISMENMLEDFRHNRISVGFLDATNTTRTRRLRMLNIIRESDISFSNVIVLDISCTEERLLAYNINGKAFNVDYSGRNVGDSISDFRQRTNHYFKVYEPVTSTELELYRDVISSYISIQNAKSCRIISEKNSDEVENLFRSFATGYYKTHGEAYHAAVDSFWALRG